MQRLGNHTQGHCASLVSALTKAPPPHIHLPLSPPPFYPCPCSYSSMSFMSLWASDSKCYMHIDTCIDHVKDHVLKGITV